MTAEARKARLTRQCTANPQALRHAVSAAAIAAVGAIAHAGGPTYGVVRTLTGGPEELFGQGVWGIGDVDGDGVPDLAVRTRDPSGTETARLFSGADGTPLYDIRGVQGHPWLGSPIAGAGDVDADGAPDVIVGNSFEPSHARVLSGPDGGLLGQIDAPRAVVGFGGAVSAAGDLNQDGHSDLLIGHVSTVDEGLDQAFVYSGRDHSILFTFDETDDLGEIGLGSAVDRAGDVNGDGIEDVIVAALLDGPVYEHPGFPPFIPPFELRHPNGSARVYSGADGMELYRFLATEKAIVDIIDGFGFSVSGAGDVNADGFDDVIIGTSSVEFTPESAGGFARVHSGLDGAVLHTFLDDGTQGDYDRFVAVDGLEDVNGDGHDDLLVGSVSDGPNGGHVRVFSGADGSELFQRHYPQTALGWRVTVSAMGDLNGDGAQDFAVGVAVNAFGAGYVEVLVSLATTCLGDLDGNGAVDGADLAALLGAWGACGRPCGADLDGGGTVDAADLSLLLGAWGGCSR